MNDLQLFMVQTDKFIILKAMTYTESNSATHKSVVKACKISI